MSTLLRGVVRMAVTWGIAWIPLRFGMMGIGALLGAPLPPLHLPTILLGNAALAFIGGAINGAIFALALARIGRERNLRTLTFGRIAAAGALGGLAYSAVGFGIAFGVHAPFTPLELATGIGMGSAMGALCGAGTLGLARRAPELRDAQNFPSLPVSDPGAA